MPKKIPVEGVPTPTGRDADVDNRAGGRFAALRFSGRLNANLAKQSEVKQRSWMEPKGLVPDDSAESSGVESVSCDPPGTSGSLRRNKVLRELVKT